MAVNTAYSERSLKQRITSRYIRAISLIGLLVTASLLMLFVALKDSRHTAFIVNLSGKQRMLSQQIALNALRYEQAQRSPQAINTRPALSKALRDHGQAMLQANRQLASGQFDSGRQVEPDSAIHDMYYARQQIFARVNRYAGLAIELADTTKQQQIAALLRQINAQSDTLLHDLNRLVDAYQREGEQKLQYVTLLAIAAWLVTIVTLLLEVIFIFQPLRDEVIRSSDQKRQFSEELQRQVRRKTEHLEKANEQLSKLAMQDPLTGLKNRLTLERDLETTLQQFHHHKSPFALLMLDIDWFKQVNDRYGHDVGDEVLKQCAVIFSTSVREGDAVYRVGGEEFIMILNRVGYQDALNIASKIRQRFEQHVFRIDGHVFHRTISGGLYHSSLSDPLKVTAMLKLVDNALYESKQNGRNRITEARQRLHPAH